MRVLIEISVEIKDAAALIAVARQQYARSTAALDVDGMTKEDALALADLTVAQMREHPRYVTPEQAIPDGAAAGLAIIKKALEDAGAMVGSSSTKILRGKRDLYKRARTLARRLRGTGRSVRRAKPSARRRKVR